MEENINISDNYLGSLKEWVPQTYELNLKHLDILLEASKNFLVIFSSVFAGSIALISKDISNIDIDLIQQISLGIVIVASISIFGLLKIRGKAVKEITDHYLEIMKHDEELSKIHRNVVDLSSDRSIDETTNEVIESLKKDPRLQDLFT